MAESHPLVDLLLYYQQHREEMPIFREDPTMPMDRFGLEERDREAIRRALEGDFGALDERLRGLLPFDAFPSDLPGWQRAMIVW